jgi:hypothetical protein
LIELEDVLDNGRTLADLGSEFPGMVGIDSGNKLSVVKGNPPISLYYGGNTRPIASLMLKDKR